jgi:hypothetical protein
MICRTGTTLWALPCEVTKGWFSAPAPGRLARSSSESSYPQLSVRDRCRPVDHAPGVPQAPPRVLLPCSTWGYHHGRSCLGPTGGPYSAVAAVEHAPVPAFKADPGQAQDQQPTVTVVVRALWPGDGSLAGERVLRDYDQQGWKLHFFSNNTPI